MPLIEILSTLAERRGSDRAERYRIEALRDRACIYERFVHLKMPLVVKQNEALNLFRCCLTVETKSNYCVANSILACLRIESENLWKDSA